MKKRKLSILGMALVALLLFVVGCSPNATGNSSAGLEEISTVEGESLSASGTLILKVNPEIALEYNEEGLVTRLVGKNEDGDKIVDTYSDYIGKDSGLVLEDLITLIGDAGYFVEEVEGESRQIILELEAGSALPQDDFLEILSMNIQNAVSNLNTEAEVVNEEEPVQNKGEEAKEPEVKVEDKSSEKPVEKSAEQPQAQKPAKQKKAQAEYIGMDRAKQIALNHAGVDASQVRWDDAEFDTDNGVPHYELEFDVGENEYEYDVHAVTGNIIKFEQDIERKQVSEKPKAQAPVSQPAPQKPKAPAPAPAPAPKPAPAKKQPAVAKELSRDEAINIALNHAGLTRSQVVFDDVELDYDDGRKKWEIEFDHGNWEYEYDIDAANGSILDFEKEYDD